jgi:hypothetical protein
MMQTRWILNVPLLAIAVVFLPGCQKRAEQKPTPVEVPQTSSTATQNTALAEFESIVARCKSALVAPKAGRVWQLEKSTTWLKTTYSPHEVAYDVTKTDSLVSPYAASIEVSFQKGIFSRNSEDEARAAQASQRDELNFVEINNFRLKFRYMDSRWKLTNVLHSLTIVPSPVPPGKLAEAPKEDFIKEISSGAPCILE